MGIYINPKGISKEEWIDTYGEMLCQPDADVIKELRDIADDCQLFEKNFPVVEIDNGGFTALAVCWCRAEVERFHDPSDPRLTMWWIVSAKNLKDVLPESDFETFVRVKGPIDAKMRFAPGIPEEYL